MPLNWGVPTLTINPFRVTIIYICNYGQLMKKLLLLLSIVLAGCGGGSADPSVKSTSLPTSPVLLCSVASSIAPAGYAGAYAIPVPTQRLNTNIQRSIGFKDYGTTNTCAYAAALEKMQANGVDRVWLYNYGVWDDFNKDVWTIVDWQISQSTFTYIVTEAKKRNIKVFLAFQFTSVDSKGNSLPYGSDISATLITKMLASHKKTITEYTEYGETIGLSGVSLDWNSFYIPNMYEHSELWATSMVSIANAIRSKFSGTITYGQIGWPFYDSRIFDVVDELHIGLTPTENANISVPLLREKYSALIKLYAQYLNNTTKPVIFEISTQSRSDYFLNGWTEDGFCVNNCIQNSYVTDFSIQAIGVEAAMQAIAAQTSFVTKSVNFHTSYWLTDTLTPGAEGFPNLSQSIRGKPAENIVKYWFSRG
jgi:hypothetical protein